MFKVILKFQDVQNGQRTLKNSIFTQDLFWIKRRNNNKKQKKLFLPFIFL